MKVALINQYAEKFKAHLQKLIDNNTPHPQLYKYENLQNFTDIWELSELDLTSMFDKSFSSQISNSLWGGSKDSAKSMMMRFIELNKEYVRSMFRNLFDENKEVGMRINRFGFHCDQLLMEIQQKDKRADKHFHEDRSMICLYLCFQNPQLCTLFDYSIFKKTMQLIEARSIPETFETERYIKLSNGLFKLLSKNEGLIDLHKQLIQPYTRYDAGQLIVHDYYLFCADQLN